MRSAISRREQRTARTMPANFGLVLDRSGSMDGEKMENLKKQRYVVDHLNENDSFPLRSSMTRSRRLSRNQP